MSPKSRRVHPQTEKEGTIEEEEVTIEMREEVGVLEIEENADSVVGEGTPLITLNVCLI